jgi:hypothetical protein
MLQEGARPLVCRSCGHILEIRSWWSFLASFVGSAIGTALLGVAAWMLLAGITVLNVLVLAALPAIALLYLCCAPLKGVRRPPTTERGE